MQAVAAANWISIQTSAEYSVLKRRKRIEEGGGDYPAPKMTKEVGSGSPSGPISAHPPNNILCSLRCLFQTAANTFFAESPLGAPIASERSIPFMVLD